MCAIANRYTFSMHRAAYADVRCLFARVSRLQRSDVSRIFIAENVRAGV